MTRIKIKNFGPIKDGFKEILDDETVNEWMDIKKVTVFIGNQGSGKSTVAKLISLFTWIEKVLVRGNYNIDWFEKSNYFRMTLLKYHRLQSYIKEKNTISSVTRENNSFFIAPSLLEYEGTRYNIKFENYNLKITENNNNYNNYHLPQIMYVPAERNFIANVTDVKSLKLMSESFIEFVTEYEKAKRQLKEKLNLPINNASVEYDDFDDSIYLSGKGFKLNLSEASSGFQSFVPLYLVSEYLSSTVNSSAVSENKMTIEEREKFRSSISNILVNTALSDEQRKIAMSELTKKFNNSAFINIVEEPEQNLFPTSQKEMLYSLLNFNNRNEGNKLIMTTHSPYLLVYLTLSVEANRLKEKGKTNELKSKINEIVPLHSTVDGNDLVVYQLDENIGTIEKLGNYKGLPSDENKLNDGLIDANDDFSKLLDLEDLCQ